MNYEITPLLAPRDHVLFIGNSLTFYHDMPEMIQLLSRSAGLNIRVMQFTVPDATIQNLLIDPRLNDALEMTDYDVVVIQSGGASAFPERHALELETLQAYKDKIFSTQPQCPMIYEAIYSAQRGLKYRDPALKDQEMTFHEFNSALEEGALSLAAARDMLVAPVGRAWSRAVSTDSLWLERLFDNDRSHPSLSGAFLTACVFYAQLLGQSAEGLSYHGGLPAEEAEFLKRLGAEVVFGNYATWMGYE